MARRPPPMTENTGRALLESVEVLAEMLTAERDADERARRRYALDRAKALRTAEVNTRRWHQVLGLGKPKILDCPCPDCPQASSEGRAAHYAVGLFRNGKPLIHEDRDYGRLCPILLFVVKARVLLWSGGADAVNEWLETQPLSVIFKPTGK